MATNVEERDSIQALGDTLAERFSKTRTYGSPVAGFILVFAFDDRFFIIN